MLQEQNEYLFLTRIYENITSEAT